jgi:hypothetical protein
MDNTPLDIMIKNWLKTYDTTSTAKYNLMKRKALPIRQLIEAMDEEEISFYEQTVPNLVIEANLDPRGY